MNARLKVERASTASDHPCLQEDADSASSNCNANTGIAPQGSPLTRPVTLLFAAASGLAVANAYFAHPMLDVMADDLGLTRAVAGLIVGATQLGYGIGLILLVPVGDLIDRRKLIVGQSLLSVLALISVGLSSTGTMLLASMAAVGLLAVVTQALVAYAASLARPAERGQVVGVVTSGIVLGILLARTVAGTLTDLSGWRTVYFVSAALTLLIASLLYKALPQQQRPQATISYPRLIGSLVTLFMEEPVLRIRAVIAMLIFADITTLLTPLVLPLSAPPFSLSHTAIGLFGSPVPQARSAPHGPDAGPIRASASAPPASRSASCCSPGCPSQCSDIRSCG